MMTSMTSMRTSTMMTIAMTTPIAIVLADSNEANIDDDDAKSSHSSRHYQLHWTRNQTASL
eukprot:1495430-Rhodomonas_salina.1